MAHHRAHGSRLVANAAMLVALALLAAVATAVCPTNGDARVLYVTANGNRGFHDILMLDTSGRVVGTAINWTSVPSSISLRKLRGMAFGPDGRLYVAGALGSHSKIVAFKAALEDDCTRSFDSVVASVGHVQQFMSHPYSLIVLPSRSVLGNLSLSPNVGDAGTRRHPAFTLMTTNQNTVSVTWMNGLDGTPLPAPKHTLMTSLLEASGNGTTPLTAREKRTAERLNRMGVFALHDAATTTSDDPVWPVAPGGYGPATAATPSLRSVRGAALCPNGRWLVVADVDSDALRVFDVRDGRLAWSIEVPAPIQLLFPPAGFLALDGGHAADGAAPHAIVTTKTAEVYVVPVVAPDDDATIDALVQILRRGSGGGANGGKRGNFDANGGGFRGYNPPPTADERRAALAPRVFVEGRFSATSGIEIDAAAGILYVAERVSRQIHRVRFDGRIIGPFGPQLLEQPEHLLLVTIARPEDLPRCYELGAVGIKYSVICVAAWIWLVLAVGGVAALVAVHRWHRGLPAVPWWVSSSPTPAKAAGSPPRFTGVAH